MRSTANIRIRKFHLLVVALAVAAVGAPAAQASLDERGIVVHQADDANVSVVPDDRSLRFTPGRPELAAPTATLEANLHKLGVDSSRVQEILRGSEYEPIAPGESTRATVSKAFAGGGAPTTVSEPDATVSVRPDDRIDRFMPTGDPRVHLVAASDDGFQWGDAWLGVMAGFGIALLLAGAFATVLMTRSHGRVAHS